MHLFLSDESKSQNKKTHTQWNDIFFFVIIDFHFQKIFFFKFFFWKNFFFKIFWKIFVRSNFFSILFKKIEKKCKKGPIHSILSNRVTFFSLFSTLRTHFEFFSERKSIITKKKSRFIVCVRFAILTQVSNKIS